MYSQRTRQQGWHSDQYESRKPTSWGHGKEARKPCQREVDKGAFLNLPSRMTDGRKLIEISPVIEALDTLPFSAPSMAGAICTSSCATRKDVSGSDSMYIQCTVYCMYIHTYTHTYIHTYIPTRLALRICSVHTRVYTCYFFPPFTELHPA